MSYEPSMHGEEPIDRIRDEIEYGFKLTSDDDGQKDITLPQFKPDPLNVFQYKKDNIIDPTGEKVQDIYYERLANFRPVSRPYGETILEEEEASIVRNGNVIYASKYLPRADELTAYVDLNTRDVNDLDKGKYDHDEYFPIRMGNFLETPTPSWTPTESWTPTISYTPTASISLTPTISYTPTISQTHTISYTPTLTNTPAPTPSPTITESPDLQSVGDLFRSLWSEANNDYFVVKSEGGMFGMRFKYRKFINDFYSQYNTGPSSNDYGKLNWFVSKKVSDPNNKRSVFNPIRKIVLEIDNVDVPVHNIDDAYNINTLYRDHEFIDEGETFKNAPVDAVSWGNMKITNEATFEYQLSEGVKIHRIYDGNAGGFVNKGFEFYIPFNEESFISEYTNQRQNRYNILMNTLNETGIPSYNNPFDSVYFIFEGSTNNLSINNISVYASEEEQFTTDGGNTWELQDPIYLTNDMYVFENGKQAGDLQYEDIIYLYSMETPTPSFTHTHTPSVTPTVTITEPTPTPTVTLTKTETISFTPTPTLTQTATDTITMTPTPTTTNTNTQTITSTNTHTITETCTETETNTLTFTPTPTMTHSETLTFTPTPTMTHSETFTFTPTPTVTETQTITYTVAVTPTQTTTNTNTQTTTETCTVTNTITITHPTPTPTVTITETVTETMKLFNINRDKGVNIIGELHVIQRDGSITTANRFFNIGRKPIFIDFDGNVDGNVDI